MNILVCDDDKEIVRAIGIYLKNEGYRVLEAYDGIEALDILRKEEIHLIIMDIMMPRMDGMQATVRIREEKNIPIIIFRRNRRIMTRSAVWEPERMIT